MNEETKNTNFAVYLIEPSANPDHDAVFITPGQGNYYSIIEATGLPAIDLANMERARDLGEWLKTNQPTGPIILCVSDTEDRPEIDTLRDAIQGGNVYFEVRNICCGHDNETEAAHSEDREKFIDILNDINNAAREKWTAYNMTPIERFLSEVQKETYRPLETGINFIDKTLGGGLIRQTLVFLLAAPGTGKTCLAAQIGEALASNGHPVVYINLEMSAEQMIARGLSGYLFRNAGIKYTATDILQGYKWTDEQREKILAAADIYGKDILANMRYNPNGIGSDIDELKKHLDALGEAARSNGQNGPIVILDYLHLLTGGGKDAQERINKATTILKAYARDYTTTVIAIGATNRDSANKLSIAAGRDSSAIDYSGDIVLGLNYEEIESGEVDAKDRDKLARKPVRIMRLKVMKSRFSIEGRHKKLFFWAAYNSFYGEGDKLPEDPYNIPFTEDPEDSEEWTTISSSNDN